MERTSIEKMAFSIPRYSLRNDRLTKIKATKPPLFPFPADRWKRRFTKVTIIREQASLTFSPLRGEKKRGGDTMSKSGKIALVQRFRNGKVLEDVDGVLDFI
ncbi:MAG: hypothetical protein ISR55_12305 [Bacteroidetes bacterium]|nr:hypothetical protein [Bacteroidota bacterium]